jgi:hypothetical protein
MQGLRTVAGMVAMITSVLGGSPAGLLAAVGSRESLVVGLSVGGAVAIAALAVMVRYQGRAWKTAGSTPFTSGNTV